jgi:hypothetical protein
MNTGKASCEGPSVIVGMGGGTKNRLGEGERPGRPGVSSVVETGEDRSLVSIFMEGMKFCMMLLDGNVSSS